MQHLSPPFRLYRDQQWPLAAPAAGERDGMDLQRARGQEVSLTHNWSGLFQNNHDSSTAVSDQNYLSPGAADPLPGS